MKAFLLSLLISTPAMAQQCFPNQADGPGVGFRVDKTEVSWVCPDKTVVKICLWKDTKPAPNLKLRGAALRMELQRLQVIDGYHAR